MKLALSILALSFPAAARAAEARLPDLVALRARLLDASVEVSGGRRYLIFSAAAGNAGAGPLELQGGAQRVYREDGSSFDLGGAALGAAFRLREIAEELRLGPVAAAVEPALAARDRERYAPELAGSPEAAVYAGGEGQPEGVSVGWAALWSRGEPGPRLDITDVRNGTYWLELELDPGGRLLDAERANNAVWIKIAFDKFGVWHASEAQPNLSVPPATGALRVYPNPWRADLHAGQPQRFEPLEPVDEVAIYALTGRRLRVLPVSGGKAEWDLRDDAGEPVASGGYFYRVEGPAGERASGKLGVLR